MFPEAVDFSEDQIAIGRSAAFEREVTAAHVLEFAAVSGDFNPLHIDADYARQTSFGRPIAHGALQVGLVSALIGMHLPGRRVLLGSVRSTFPAPLFYPARVRVSGQVASWNRELRSGTLHSQVTDLSSGNVTADVSIGFTLHDERVSQASETGVSQPAAARKLSPSSQGPPIVLVTGANGGLGVALVAHLSTGYTVLALQRRASASPETEEVITDLSVDGWQHAVEQALDGRPLYGIVHTAWPGFPHGSLLEASDAIIREQVQFGAEVTIQLSRFLAAHHAARGGRCIVLGSTAATFRPLLSTASYSLGKSVLENTVRLLAPELARKQITINAVCPSFVPAGMNIATTDRQRLREAALVPLGRLCEPEDVGGMVSYLLSEAGAFVSGQVMLLSGGRL